MLMQTAPHARRQTVVQSIKMVTSDDIKPHLCTTLFITGSFLIAWSWDLALYGFSHLLNGVNPLQEQLGFGNSVAPNELLLLVLEYAVVVGISAYFSFALTNYCGTQPWCPGAIMAVEFIPAPFFAGKLMAYLGNFSRLSTVDQALINFGATAFAAMLASAANTPHSCSLSLGDRDYDIHLGRFPQILANTLGFGLGIAWNALLSQVLLGSSQDSEMDILQVIALFGYLLVVTLITFRIAAHNVETEEPTLWQRQVQLLSFAFHVVCAFSLVAFFNSILHSGWIGAVESLVILVALSAIMPAIVASVDLDDATTSPQEEEQVKVGLGSCCLLDVLVFVPCVWCICPWIPLAWLLAGMSSDVGIKERWYKLIAFVAGLAASIQASSMLTAATDGFATLLGICNVKHCRHPWIFVGLQVICAIITTAVLLMALPYVTAPQDTPTQGTGENQALLSDEQRRERKSLVGKAKSLFKGRRKSSKNEQEAKKPMKIQVHGSISFDP